MKFLAKSLGVCLTVFGVLILLANVGLGVLLIGSGVFLLVAVGKAGRAKTPPPVPAAGRAASGVPPRQEAHPELPLIGNAEPVCPHCSQALDRMPGRKKKCPHCGEFIYVRTRPADRQKILVTEAETHVIEDQWSVVRGVDPQDNAGRERHEAERQRLKKKFGREPGANDVRWAVLNKELLTHAQNMDWGLYRNTRMRMAEILGSEQKDRDSLATYLEVCYLDLNGPNNCGGMRDAALLREFPPWRPRDGFLAPGILSRVHRLVQKAGLSPEQLHELFTACAGKVQKSLRLPLSPGKAWAKLQRELDGD